MNDKLKEVIKEFAKEFKETYEHILDDAVVRGGIKYHSLWIEKAFKAGLEAKDKAHKEDMIWVSENCYCPESYGFEGAETFTDCDKCFVCKCKALTT